MLCLQRLSVPHNVLKLKEMFKRKIGRLIGTKSHSLSLLPVSSLTDRSSSALAALSASALPSAASAPASSFSISACPAVKAALNSCACSGLPNLIANVCDAFVRPATSF